MKLKLLALALVMSFAFSSNAMAIRVLENGVEKGQIAEVDCTDGLDCDVNGNKLEIQGVKVETRTTFAAMSPAAKVGTAVLITNADSATNCGASGTGSVAAVCIKGATGSDTTWTALTN